jgi:hypothetical protein
VFDVVEMLQVRWLTFGSLELNDIRRSEDWIAEGRDREGVAFDVDDVQGGLLSTIPGVRHPADVRLALTLRHDKLFNLGKYVFQTHMIKVAQMIHVHGIKFDETHFTKRAVLDSFMRCNHYWVKSKAYHERVRMTRGDVFFEDCKVGWESYHDRNEGSDADDWTLKNLVVNGY